MERQPELDLVTVDPVASGELPGSAQDVGREAELLFPEDASRAVEPRDEADFSDLLDFSGDPDFARLNEALTPMGRIEHAVIAHISAIDRSLLSPNSLMLLELVEYSRTYRRPITPNQVGEILNVETSLEDFTLPKDAAQLLMERFAIHQVVEQQVMELMQ